MSPAVLRSLVLGLGFVLYVLGLPARAMLLPPPVAPAPISVQSVLAAETEGTGDDSGAGTEGTDTGTDTGTGTDESGSEDDGGSSDDDSD
jgi:hypothetical protein